MEINLLFKFWNWPSRAELRRDAVWSHSATAYLHICDLRVLLLLVAVREVAALYLVVVGGRGGAWHHCYHHHHNHLTTPLTFARLSRLTPPRDIQQHPLTSPHHQPPGDFLSQITCGVLQAGKYCPLLSCNNCINLHAIVQYITISGKLQNWLGFGRLATSYVHTEIYVRSKDLW